MAAQQAANPTAGLRLLAGDAALCRCTSQPRPRNAPTTTCLPMPGRLQAINLEGLVLKSLDWRLGPFFNYSGASGAR